MSGFAVRNDGILGWRSVGGPAELFDNEVFSDREPAPVTPAPPTIEELTTEAKTQRDKLLAVAANRMGPLRDAVEDGLATDDEVTRLAMWKGYRIDLNRIETQEGFPIDIQWPESPDAVKDLQNPSL